MLKLISPFVAYQPGFVFSGRVGQNKSFLVNDAIAVAAALEQPQQGEENAPEANSFNPVRVQGG